MSRFCLDAALDARADAVARMLADKAESFAEYYLHGAAPSRQPIRIRASSSARRRTTLARSQRR
jgi:hypothetical protein